ncbi:hypothetical protein [Nocardiopsis kunsanensis]|uniref:hypothetical protein n=1 Tax=Nocardiopsis kunsanensis TaxID=141693 RepID=UPI00034A0BF3|nr:hypothetical protein [Nocardiopsis kunsanensis]
MDEEPLAAALRGYVIGRLLHELFKVEHGVEHVLGWSVFRRAHQARAQRCHYRRQAALES